MAEHAGHLLRAARHEAGISQEELAHRVGKSQMLISRIERGDRGTTSEEMELLLAQCRRPTRLDMQAELALLRSLRDAVEDELDVYTRPKVLAALAALRGAER